LLTFSASWLWRNKAKLAIAIFGIAQTAASSWVTRSRILEGRATRRKVPAAQKRARAMARHIQLYKFSG